MEFFNRYRNGELISRITNDISTIQSAVSNYFIEGIRESLTIVGLVCWIIYLSPELAFYGLVVMPISLYPIALIARKMRKTSKKLQEKNADLSSKLVEIFNNMELIKASSGEKLEYQDFTAHNQDLFKISMKTVRISELTTPVMETLGAIAVAAVIFVGGYKVINAILTRNYSRHFVLNIVTGLLLFLTGVYLFMAPMFNLLLITSAIGVYFILESISSIAFAVQNKNTLYFWWLAILVGVMQFLLGLIIILGLPSTALWVVGVLAGINFLIAGVVLISMYISTKCILG